MTKKHFIALADAIRYYNQNADCASQFYPPQLDLLAGFCQNQNPHFNKTRWLGYIEGKCGPNGGTIK